MKPFQILFFWALSTSFLTGQTGTQLTQNMLHNGVTRSYILYIPDSYNSQQDVPMVVELHGHTSNMNQQIVYGDFRKIADTAGFILVVPNGLYDTSGNRYWNFGQIANGSDDIGFLSQLINKVATNYMIDLDRVYFTGLSNGGFMSNYLACHLSQKITAIASVSGTLIPYQITNCLPNHPMPILYIHGTSDAIVPYSGSLGIASAEDWVQHWVSFNNCSSPITEQLPDIDPNDGCTVSHYIYPNGNNGSSVEFYKIIGGGHTWPGANINIPIYGNTNHDFNASKEIWRFFSQYNQQDLLQNKQQSLQLSIKIFPNPTVNYLTIYTHDYFQSITLYTITGSVVQQWNSVNHPIQTKNLKKGIYIIEGINKRRKINKRCIVR